MFTGLNIDTLLSNIIEPITLSKRAICWATGMSYLELDSFLNDRELGHSGNRVDYEALEELKDWYLKKMRRFVRNALAHRLVSGSEDDLLFLEFCNLYRKLGHKDVRSWDDIDEYRLLMDFEAKCLDTSHLFEYNYFCNKSLFGKIHQSFLFHLRLKRTPKYRARPSNTCITFILCNRYHIFTTEADSNANYTIVMANGPFSNGLIRRGVLHRMCLPSRQKHT